MNRPLTALFASLEALLVVGIGIGIPLVPLTLMWAIQYGLQLDFIVFWRGAVDAWLLGHGTDIRFALDPAVAAGTGLAGAEQGFVVTIAPLAFAVVTLLLGLRAGRRVGETPHRSLGLLVAVGVFALLSLGATLSALHPSARPSIWQGALLPTLVFALGVLVGSELSRRGSRDRIPDVAPAWLPRALADRVPKRLAPVVGVVLAGGSAAALLVLTASAIAVGVLVAVDYAEVIAIYEGVQSGVLGGGALTVAQLAFVPNLVIWAASWFIGPGFAIGAGSAVSALGTDLGPLPAIPVLGALPTGEWAFAFVGLLVPVVAGFLSGMVFRARLERAGISGPVWLGAAGIGIGLAGGALLGALAWIASGSAGPGRLVEVGSSWLLVGAWSALELGLAAALALVVTGLRSSERS